jgi:membrane dipeptidase
MQAPEARPFDFGLTEAQEARAGKLHRESIVFDMLSMHGGSNIFAAYPKELQADLKARTSAATSRSQILAEAIYFPFEMAWLGRSDLIREWLQASGLTCGAYGIEDLLHDAPDPLACDWDVRIRRYAQMPWLRHVTKAEEIRKAKREGAVALYANCQPLIPIPRNLKSFDVAYAKGLRSFMLTYNRMDNVGVGCTERVDAGLSMFGVDVVKRCNDLGIIVDVSHCGHGTTMDACRVSRKPVTANHTAARSVFSHARGKTDDELRAIASTGGVIGIVAVPHFLSGEPSPSIVQMLDHIDHVVKVVGWQHVALGTDWPWPVPDEVARATLGADYDREVGFRAADRVDRRRRLVGFEDCRDLPNLTRGLVHRGYDDLQIRGVLGENALRVFEEACG